MSNNVSRSLNRLAKWRAHFAGWQLGTRLKDDPECEAVRDHREATLMTKVELTAIVGLLLEKGIITHEDFHAHLIEEAGVMEQVLEQRWPGARATDDGMTYDLAQASSWMQGWRP